MLRCRLLLFYIEEELIVLSRSPCHEQRTSHLSGGDSPDSEGMLTEAMTEGNHALADWRWVRGERFRCQRSMQLCAYV